MKSPNWQEARDFVNRIAGRADPAMTFQVFDDKGERYELASWKHGRLTDQGVRQWLISKAAQGCGIFVTISACDGKGRRRKNVTHGRALFIDLDGEPLPTEWQVQPDIIDESSPGKYHAYWLIDNVEDLNAFSDCQARLAKFYGGDPKVFDPPRVMRLPGFFHQKGKAFRSHVLEKSDRDPAFERYTMDDIASKHPCDYSRPAARAEGGRSDEPAHGWDSPADVARALAYLATVKIEEFQNRNNSGYQVANRLKDFGVSSELSFDLMWEIWNPRFENPLEDHEVRHVVKSAGRYGHSSPGVEAVTAAGDDFAEFEPDPLEIPDEPVENTEEFEFEGPDRAETDQFDFESGASAAPAKKPKDDRPKTVKRATGGLSWSYGHEVRAEALTWLWPDRIPRGKLTLIAGFPDQGKSQIMLGIAAAVTTGGPWPNGEGFAQKGVAIILSSEDDEADTLIPRLAAAGADLQNIIIVRSMVKEIVEGKKTTRVLNIEDDLRNLQAIMKQVHDSGKFVRMIGLDPINAYFGGVRKGDTHKNSDMRALLTPIKEWAGMLKVAIVAITHFNKGGNAHALYRVTDSGAITAAARSVYFALKKDNPDPKAEVERIFVSGKHNLAADKIKGLSYSISTREVSEVTGVANQVMPYVVFGGEDATTVEEAMAALKPGRKSDARDDAQKFLLEMLEDGPVARKEVEAEAKLAGYTPATIRRACEDLGIRSARKPGEFQGQYYLWPPTPGDDFTDDDLPEDDDMGDDPDFG